jgi:hypothetical protein
VDRPQVRTLDGFVLRRTGGYNIYEIAFAGMNRYTNRQSSILRERIIRVAVQPTLPRLCGCDDRMPARVRVFARMMVWRAVAAKRGSTCLAGAQMDPRCADLYAFFAFTALRLFD